MFWRVVERLAARVGYALAWGWRCGAGALSESRVRGETARAAVEPWELDRVSQTLARFVARGAL